MIGGSAGSFKITSRIISCLPADFHLPVIVIMHRLRNVKTGIVSALANNSKISIYEPNDKDPIESGSIYIAPANYHLLIEKGCFFSLSTFSPVNHSRPSIDLSMKSAANVYRKHLLGILVSGANTDGAQGMMAIHKAGGTTIVQDPLEAEIPSMPEAAIDSFRPDHIYNADKIIKFIEKLGSRR